MQITPTYALVRSPAAINTALTETLETKVRNHPRPCLPVRTQQMKAQKKKKNLGKAFAEQLTA